MARESHWFTDQIARRLGVPSGSARREGYLIINMSPHTLQKSKGGSHMKGPTMPKSMPMKQMGGKMKKSGKKMSKMKADASHC
jgi:hypothetical protein